jgi:hypothetical protein
MKTSILARAAALVSAAAITFLLLQSLATYGIPAETAPQLAQAKPVATSR